MSNYVVTGEQLTSIADAIRAKTCGSSDLVFPTGFVSGIDSVVPVSSLIADTRENSTTVPGYLTLQPGQSVELSASMPLPTGVLTDTLIAISGASISVEGLTCYIPSSSLVTAFPAGSYSVKIRVRCYNHTQEAITLPTAVTLTVSIKYLKVAT